MKILFIAPLPPPIDGQSKASKTILDRLLEEKHEVEIVYLNKRSSLKNNYLSFTRIVDIIKILFKVWRKRKNNDIIFISLAESFLGNLRDLFIYCICIKYKQKIIVHMLGGAGMKEIISSKGIRFKTNKYFIEKFKGVIVEGPLNFEIFSRVISKDRIHIVPNFAEEYLLVNDKEIKEKYSLSDCIQVLFLSNLLPGKGYKELVHGFISLDSELRDKLSIVFVGGFESDKSKMDFLDTINKYDNVKYLGSFIDGTNKRELFLESQIFCLPTYYPYEGQPISILEAYATGCVVITTNHSGIPYIFTDKINGYIVESRSAESIKRVLKEILLNKNILENIAFTNRDEALLKYRTSIFQDSIMKIFTEK